LRDLEITPESIKQVLKILLEERKETKQRIEEPRACHQLGVLTLVANNAQSIK
jgi:hypothetical protein